jgi:hypothetical protein
MGWPLRPATRVPWNGMKPAKTHKAGGLGGWLIPPVFSYTFGKIPTAAAGRSPGRAQIAVAPASMPGRP